jgi:lysophospholipase L1-like esterase
MIGINDIASGVATDAIVDNVRQTIKKLSRPGTHVYLTLALPVAETYPRKFNARVDELNTAYIRLAQATGASLVDFRGKMQTEDGFLRDEFSTDGLHLTPDGYRVWRDAIAPLVQKECGLR